MLSGHLIGAFLIVWLFLFYNVPAILWLLTAALIVCTLYALGSYSLLTSSFLMLCFLAIYTVLCIKPIRKNLITRGLIEFFRKKLPKISSTESQAIDAGDVWWEGDIFFLQI